MELQNYILRVEPNLKNYMFPSSYLNERYDECREILGEGGQGRVKKLKEKDSDNYVASKIMIYERKDYKDILAELSVLKDFQHPNIISLFGFCCFTLDPYIPALAILLEYCEGCSLGVVIHTLSQFFGERVINYIMCDVVSAIQYLHHGGVIHRDIKCDNILLHGDGTVRLADFGLAAYKKLISFDLLRKCGTQEYMAPEVEIEGKYNEKCDIWSLGITCIVLAGLECELEMSIPDKVRKTKIINGDEFEPPIPNFGKKFTRNFRNFIKDALCINQYQRPSIDYLMVHPFITEYKNDTDVPPTVPVLQKFREALVHNPLPTSSDEEDLADDEKSRSLLSATSYTSDKLLQLGDGFEKIEMQQKLLQDKQQELKNKIQLQQEMKKELQLQQNQQLLRLNNTKLLLQELRRQRNQKQKQEQKQQEKQNEWLRQQQVLKEQLEQLRQPREQQQQQKMNEEQQQQRLQQQNRLYKQLQANSQAMKDHLLQLKMQQEQQKLQRQLQQPHEEQQQKQQQKQRQKWKQRLQEMEDNFPSLRQQLRQMEQQLRQLQLLQERHQQQMDSSQLSVMKSDDILTTILRKCPLKVNAIALWNSSSNGTILFIGANEGIYCLNLDDQDNPGMRLIVRYRCLWLTIHEDIMISLSGNHPKLHRHDLRGILLEHSQSSSNMLLIRLVKMTVTSKIDETEGCMRVSLCHNQENNKHWLACALPDSILLLQWEHNGRSFFPFKKFQVDDMPQPLLTFETFIRQDSELPLVCVGVLPGRDDNHVRFRIIDFNRREGKIELFPSDQNIPDDDDDIDTTCVRQINIDHVLVCYKNLARQFDLMSGCLLTETSWQVPTLSFNFTIENAQCRQNSLYSFHKHGFQATALTNGEVLQLVYDPNRVYRVVGFSNNYAVLESQPLKNDTHMASCDLLMLLMTNTISDSYFY